MKRLSTTCSVRRGPSRHPTDAWLRLPLVALALLALARTAPAEPLGHRLNPLPEPTPAPQFALFDMDDEAFALADFRGQVVMLNFWATWCPPCRREMPSMERLYRQLRGQGFAVLAVNQFEGPDHVFGYLGQLQVDPSFTILFDPDSSTAEAYRVVGLPTTFLIDKSGRVRYRAAGGREFDHPDVVALIRKLIAETEPPNDAD